MRRLFLSLTITSLSIAPAAAADVSGDWLVQDGSALIRIANCNGRVWGIVAWANRHAMDSHNPDPSQRQRRRLGMPIIRGMHAVQANKWEGAIYNPQNGQTYQGRMSLQGPNVLDVQGCVLGGLFCGGQKWRRVASRRASVGSAPDQGVCAALFRSARPSHEGRLK